MQSEKYKTCTASVMDKSDWPANNPDSLCALCLKFCVNNVRETICCKSDDDSYHLRPFIWLPPSLSDQLLLMFGQLSRQHLNLFDNPTAVNFRRIDLRSIDSLADDDLRRILAHHPLKLCLSSNLLSPKSIDLLCEMGSSIISLSLIGCSKILDSGLADEDDFCDDEIDSGYLKMLWEASVKSDKSTRSVDLRAEKEANRFCPKLRSIALRNMRLNLKIELPFNSATLLRLDLSDSTVNNEDLANLFSSLTSLEILSLHNVLIEKLLRNFVNSLCSLNKLR